MVPLGYTGAYNDHSDLRPFYSFLPPCRNLTENDVRPLELAGHLAQFRHGGGSLVCSRADRTSVRDSSLEVGMLGATSLGDLGPAIFDAAWMKDVGNI